MLSSHATELPPTFQRLADNIFAHEVPTCPRARVVPDNLVSLVVQHAVPLGCQSLNEQYVYKSALSQFVLSASLQTQHPQYSTLFPGTRHHLRQPGPLRTT